MGTRELEDLISSLSVELSSSDYGGPSPRDQAIEEVGELGPQVVPALISRLEALLADTADHREKLAEVVDAWDIWYDEMDSLTADHGLGDHERHLTIRSEDLPSPDEVRRYRDPSRLKQGLVVALHRLGDERAGAVLADALRDPVCVHRAALALRDIRSDQAVPFLLDAATLVDPDGMGFPEVVAALLARGR
ncbi:hypothetical protein ACQPZP_20845 [Spirillospora sp. CA-142024]|uniref:hypothetical protein n=1 Tax=Spirillospora sp. CA-142024 TaxID=3240036 RepID=UPI003D8F34DC